MGIRIRAVWLLIGSLFLLAVGCSSSKPESKALDVRSPDWDLDRGDILVHVGIMRELANAQRRLDLSPLLDPKAVFEQLKATRQSEHLAASSTQLSVGADVSTGLALNAQSVKNTAGQTKGSKGTTSASTGSTDKTTTKSEGATTETGSSTSNTTGSEETAQDTAGSETTSTYGRSSDATAPGTRLSPSIPSTAGLVASYHSLLYATAETVLAGQALESLFNVDTVPDGYAFVALPLVFSIQPGRTTRTNYIADTSIDLRSFAQCGISELHVLAVAPLGLSTFGGDANLLARALQVAVGAGIPIGAAVAQLKSGLTAEEMESLTVVARRPEVQVAIQGSNIHVRYLGTKDIGGTVRLTPTTLNVEVMALVRRGSLDAKSCATTLASEAQLSSFIDETASTQCPDGGAGRSGEHPAQGSARDRGSDGGTDGGVRPPLQTSTDTSVSLTLQRLKEIRCDEGKPHAPADPFNGAAAGIGAGSVLVGVTSYFVPTEQLSDKAAWSPYLYSTGSWQLTPFYARSRPPVRVTSLTQGPGGDLVATLSEPSDDGFVVCVAMKDAKPPAAPPISFKHPDPARPTVKKAPTSFRVPLAKPLERDGSVYVSVRSANDDCKGEQDWALVPVKVVKATPPEEPEKAIKLASVHGTLESEAVVVRIEYEAPLDKVTVTLNGADAVIRKIQPRTKNGKVVGGVVYAALPQKLSRKEDYDRRVHVDVGGKGFPTATTDVRATW